VGFRGVVPVIFVGLDVPWRKRLTVLSWRMMIPMRRRRRMPTPSRRRRRGWIVWMIRMLVILFRWRRIRIPRVRTGMALRRRSVSSSIRHGWRFSIVPIVVGRIARRHGHRVRIVVITSVVSLWSWRRRRRRSIRLRSFFALELGSLLETLFFRVVLCGGGCARHGCVQ
jgi:hypothetical protein